MRDVFDLESLDLPQQKPARPAAVSAKKAQPANAEKAVEVEQTVVRDQRAALADLIRLSSECVRVEAEIDQRQEQALREARRVHQADTAAADAEHQRLASEIDVGLDEKNDHIRQADLRHRASLQTDFDIKRRKNRDEHRAAETRVQSKMQDDIWLAQSVLDAARSAARKNINEEKEAVRQLDEKLDELVLDAQGRLQTYFGHIPAAEVPAAENAEQSERATVDCQPYLESCESHLHTLQMAQLPRLMGSGFQFVLLVLVIGGAGVIAWYATGQPQTLDAIDWPIVGGAMGAALVIGTILAVVGRKAANSQMQREWTAFSAAEAEGRAANSRRVIHTRKAAEAQVYAAQQSRDADVARIKEEFEPRLLEMKAKLDESFTSLKLRLARKLEELQKQVADHRQAHEQEHQNRAAAENQRHTEATTGVDATLSAAEKVAHDEREAARETLRQRLETGLSRSRGEGIGTDKPLPAWDDPSWDRFTPAQGFISRLPFGRMNVDLRSVATAEGGQPPKDLPLPEPFDIPAMLGFPGDANLVIRHDRNARSKAIDLLRGVMARLLVTLPPGRVRFTLIDPVGLGQSFAGFMHLADYDDQLVGQRVWTEAEHVERQLTDLTEHMETVIQKYLRNEYATIDAYNEQAGELAEPYRFLAISDAPTNFSEDALRRLAAIAASGSRCGVHVLMCRDINAGDGHKHLEDVEAHASTIELKGDKPRWLDETFSRFPLAIDAPPTDDRLTPLMHAIGAAAKINKRVEVDFRAITPKDDDVWSATSEKAIDVPVGKSGANRIQHLRLGQGMAQHVLVAGKTGSGKSTLLNAIITNLALWYSPAELELYLIDFKRGVEFKPYVTHKLPHARAIAVESDREFGLSVLQRLDAELARRGELYRDAGVQDLAGYRKLSPLPVASGPSSEVSSASTDNGQRTTDKSKLPYLPRTLLLIDEFQEFFTEDDRLSQEAGLLLDRLVRQGRAFGIHIILGSQTLSGASGLARSTVGQMAVRVALQCSEADSQMILGDNNSAARLLSRPGEAIYNDQGGAVEANSPFQVAWLPDDTREKLIATIAHRESAVQRARPVVFEGNRPADITANAELGELLQTPPTTAPLSAEAYLGEPVAIKAPTAATFRRTSGQNLLVIGQDDRLSTACMASAILSLAAAHPAGSAKFVLMDGTPADSSLSSVLSDTVAALPHEVQQVGYRDMESVLTELSAEVSRRRDADADEREGDQPAVYVILHGLQRFRMLRRSEDDFSLSFNSDAPPKPQADKAFADLVREGSSVGVFVMMWVDSAAGADRVIDRSLMREIDHRVLLQMSATDSSMLIDSPAANRLGGNRALVYSEEQGTLEKFRPYDLPDEAWLSQVKQSLKGKSQGPREGGRKTSAPEA